MTGFWDERYAEEEFAYGIEPNAFFAEELNKLTPGKILLPADGQGRNGVYAASLGWDVTAFDMSEVGKQRALQLAERKGVSMDFQVGTIPNIGFPGDEFDVIALVFAHFPPAKRREYHRWMIPFLKPGGTLLLEGFSKSHIQFNSVRPEAGGPKDVQMLFSSSELEKDFEGFEIIHSEQPITHLEEGPYHRGESAVARLVAKKP